MTQEKKILSLMEKISEVMNLAIELKIDITEECVSASRKVLGRGLALDDWDLQMLLSGHPLGPTSVQ